MYVNPYLPVTHESTSADCTPSRSLLRNSSAPLAGDIAGTHGRNWPTVVCRGNCNVRVIEPTPQRLVTTRAFRHAHKFASFNVPAHKMLWSFRGHCRPSRRCAWAIAEEAVSGGFLRRNGLVAATVPMSAGFPHGATRALARRQTAHPQHARVHDPPNTAKAIRPAPKGHVASRARNVTRTCRITRSRDHDEPGWISTEAGL